MAGLIRVVDEATADPVSFPPEASYVRGADAKPQDKARIARLGAA